MGHQDTKQTSMRPRLKELNDNPYVKLLNFANLQTTEYQRNKKFYVKLLPLVENFICSNFAPV